MIAAETTRTAAIIFPCRNVRKQDVANRTRFGTLAAVDTHISIHRKLPVSNHEPVKVGPNDMTESPRRQSQCQLAVAALAVDHHLDVVLQLQLGLLFLFPFPFRRVSVHERQTNVALWHD